MTINKRLTLAVRILLGLPVNGVRIGEDMLLDKDKESELDYTKTAPFDLVFGDVVKDGPPEEVFAKDRFRVCLFPEKDARAGESGRKRCWLTLELRGDGTWYHLMTMHESRLAIMLGVLEDVGDYFDGYHVSGERLSASRDREVGPRGDYHAELGCLGEGHKKALTVDLIGSVVDGTEDPVRLAIWDDKDDWDPAGVVDLSPFDARRLAGHLVKAADAADKDETGQATSAERTLPEPRNRGTMSPMKLIAAFTHGNALGVVVEPAGRTGEFTEEERKATWQVRIGPLVPEAAVGAEFPEQDYRKVVSDLAAFCKEQGIEPRGLRGQ